MVVDHVKIEVMSSNMYSKRNGDASLILLCEMFELKLCYIHKISPGTILDAEVC